MNMDINEKEIEQANRKIDLSGFKMQDELNPKIWDKEQNMKSDVRKTLLKIADDYFESLEIPGVDIEDVTMTGSLANYNWSKYSDVDLHIVVDYNDIPVDEDLVADFLKSKSDAWNENHDIKIYGYDVEIYVQDENKEHHSTGVYSTLKDEWVTQPKKKRISFNDKSVKDKSNRFMDRIENLYDIMDEVENTEITKRAEKLIEKIKKMRKSGLESGGEFSVENIVFKVLRRNGMLDRLYDIKTVTYDKSMTLESININEGLFDTVKNINPKKEITKAKKKLKKFREGLKQEGKETREAWGVVVDSINEKRDLTSEEKKEVNKQLGDLLKTTGLTLATFLPGGILYILLTRIPRLKKYLIPSAFLEESKDFEWVEDVKEKDFWYRGTYVLYEDHSGPGIMEIDNFEYENSAIQYGDYFHGEPTIVSEFDLVFPGGTDWEIIMNCIDTISDDYIMNRIQPKEEYVYDKRNNEIV
tara:strand:+ start:6233 stop:7648 length:1416 start_codon:yes stop_codon:yes gene_type:complete